MGLEISVIVLNIMTLCLSFWGGCAAIGLHEKKGDHLVFWAWILFANAALAFTMAVVNINNLTKELKVSTEDYETKVEIVTSQDMRSLENVQADTVYHFTKKVD